MPNLLGIMVKQHRNIYSFMAEMLYFDFLPSHWGGQTKFIIDKGGLRPQFAFTRVWGCHPPDK